MNLIVELYEGLDLYFGKKTLESEPWSHWTNYEIVSNAITRTIFLFSVLQIAFSFIINLYSFWFMSQIIITTNFVEFSCTAFNDFSL